ncbi:hypothetical protein D9M68_774280 [compost metagenome]
MEHHSLVPVQAGEEAAHFATERPLHRHLLGGHHVHREATRAQGRRRLQADETGADQNHRSRALARLDNGPGIGQRTQHEHIGQVEPRHVQPPRFRAGGDEQDVVGQPLA